MILERIFEFPDEKTALIYEGRSYLYGFLKSEIKRRATTFNNSTRDALLCHSNDLENLINLFSLNFIGRKAVFAGKNNGFFQNDSCFDDFEIIDYVPDNEESIKSNFFFESNRSTRFLGILSSGSTGNPKIIWKDYQSWVSAFSHQSEIFNIYSDETIFVLDALAYSANLNSVLHALWQGNTVFLAKLKEAKLWDFQIEKNAVTSIFLVPSHYRILASLSSKNLKLQSLVSAGEKLDANTATALKSKFKNALLTEYYGAAELGHISYIQGQEIIDNPHSVGKAFPEVNIKIIEDKVWVESPYVSPDYRKTPTVLDIAYFENDLLYLLGRSGRMFNKRGLNIFAEEIENATRCHPLILDSFANLEKLHDRPIITLFYELKPESKLTKSELKSHLLSVLPSEKLPNRLVKIQKIPRLSNGKVDFKVLSKTPSEEDLIV